MEQEPVDKHGYRVLQFSERQWREDPEFINCVGVTLDKIRKDNHFDMTYWISTDRRLENGLEGADDDEPCGTSGCLAGHAYFALRMPKVRTVRDFRRLPRNDTHDWVEEGRQLLGLTKDDANRLFLISSWPYHLRELYRSTYLLQDRREIQRIRYNAVVGAVEWMIRYREDRRMRVQQARETVKGETR